MKSEGGDTEFQKQESELEKLIREVKHLERQEEERKKEMGLGAGRTHKKLDKLTAHYDQTTIRLKLKIKDASHH